MSRKALRGVICTRGAQLPGPPGGGGYWVACPGNWTAKRAGAGKRWMQTSLSERTKATEK